MTPLSQTLKALIDNVSQIILGKREVIELAVACVVCRGHLLIEDVPGLGKTMLARAMARSLSVNTKRIQFTPDLVPSDITGVSIYDQKIAEFHFRPGPVFTNILLADEINRATPRTQSALLECMEEAQVSIDGVTHPLPRVFMVIATQNPVENAGTFPLPEAQLDRFFMRLSMGYPSLKHEAQMIRAQSHQHPVTGLQSVVAESRLLEVQEAVKEVHVDASVLNYICEIVAATREHEALRLGSSPRGSLALTRACQAMAVIAGEDFVKPDVVIRMAPHVLAHRLILRPQVQLAGTTTAAVVDEILQRSHPPVL